MSICSVVVGEVAEDADDVVGRRGPVGRDRGVLVELALALRDQVEVLLAEQVEHLDAGPAVLAELDAVVDLEAHQHLALVELDVLDPAHPDAADLDHVALVEAAGVGEVGLVGVAAETGELAEVEGGRHDHEHHDERDRAEAERAGLGVAPHLTTPVGVSSAPLHRGASEWKFRLARPARTCCRPGIVPRLLRQRDLAGEAADVVAVPGAVGAGPGLVGHRLGQPVEELDDLLLVLRLVEQLGQLLQLRRRRP